MRNGVAVGWRSSCMATVTPEKPPPMMAMTRGARELSIE
jgi:hypothetical protein